MPHHETIEYVDAYYADSWVDIQALANPKLSPRGFRSAGPFATYPEAAGHVPRHRREATHFKVRKVFIRSDLVTFITNDHPPVISPPIK